MDELVSEPDRPPDPGEAAIVTSVDALVGGHIGNIRIARSEDDIVGHLVVEPNVGLHPVRGIAATAVDAGLWCGS